MSDEKLPVKTPSKWKLSLSKRARADYIRTNNKIIHQHAKSFHLTDINISEIRDNDLDPKLAEVKNWFNELLEQDLVKQFKRNKITLYVFSQPFTFGKKPNPMLQTVGIINGKSIYIPDELTEILSADELKATIAHEMSHHMHLDLHPKQRSRVLKGASRSSETFADKMAVALGANPEDLISAFTKITAYQKKVRDDYIDFLSGYSDQSIYMKKAADLMEQPLSILSPNENHETRAKNIRETAEKLADPAQKDQLNDEIKNELLSRHKKLFPKQFSRLESNYRESSRETGMER